MNSRYTNEQVLSAARKVRKQVLEFVIERGGCYLAQACSGAEILCALYMQIMNLGESEGCPDALPFPGVPSASNMDYQRGSAYNGPRSPELDRFFLSPAHYACVLYSTLEQCGRISHAAVEKFNVDGWNMEMIGAEHSPGFETTAGSLAQTVSIAAGTAHARKLKGECGRVFVMLSDGELQEGQTWEAIQAASFYGLDNLMIYIDVNGHQLEGLTKDVMNIEPLEDRFKAFGAACVCVDGHNVDELRLAAETEHQGKPMVVLCYTSPSRDMPLVAAREPYTHFIRLKPDEVEEAKAFYRNM